MKKSKHIVVTKQEETWANVYTPDTFDPSPLFPEPRHRDAARYLVHAIESERIFHKVETRFVPLKAKYLKTIMGDDYRKVREGLEEAGDIVVDHHYLVGQKSFGYRLADRHQDARYRRTELETTKVRKSILKWRRKEHAEITLDVHKYLREWLYKVELDIDVTQATNRHQLHCLRLQDKDFHFTVCHFGRVHTNLTNMPSELRQYLRVQGQKLWNVDIVNSQPFFLALLLCNDGKKVQQLDEVLQVAGAVSECHFHDKIMSNPTTPYHPHLHYDSEMNYPYDSKALTEALCLLRNLQLRPDMKSYIDLVCEGKLYESLCSNVPRDIAKKHLFEAVFFGKHNHRCALEDEFKKLYPTVYDFIRQMKRKDYRHLAHALQRTESQFVIHTVCNRLMREYPDLPIQTIHDSILTTDPGLVHKIMIEEFWKLGLIPRLRVEAA